jgi:hypothetical protein
MNRLDMDEGALLKDAVAAVDSELEDGVICPCCGQYCKLYKRKLNSGQALFIIEVVVAYQRTEDWVDARVIWRRYPSMQRGDHAYLQHWGLLEAQPNEDPEKRSSGFWMPTQAGIDFANRRTRVPSHIYLYNNALIKFSSTQVDVVESLGKKFNYAELMRAR